MPGGGELQTLETVKLFWEKLFKLIWVITTLKKGPKKWTKNSLIRRHITLTRHRSWAVAQTPQELIRGLSRVLAPYRPNPVCLTTSLLALGLLPFFSSHPVARLGYASYYYLVAVGYSRTHDLAVIPRIFTPFAVKLGPYISPHPALEIYWLQEEME